MVMTPVLIVTRPASQGAAFARDVQAQWRGPLRVICSPLITIKRIPVDADLDLVTGLVFTSVNGVAAIEDLTLPSGLTAWCVGPKTAMRAKRAGFVPIVGPGDAAGLVHLIAKQDPTGTLAHIRGRYSRSAISHELGAIGIHCLDVVAYDQPSCPLTADAEKAVKGKDPVLFPLFSPRTGTILSEHGPFVAETHVVAISEAAREAVAFSATTVKTAGQPNETAMITATLHTLTALTQGRGLGLGSLEGSGP